MGSVRGFIKAKIFVKASMSGLKTVVRIDIKFVIILGRQLIEITSINTPRVTTVRLNRLTLDESGPLFATLAVVLLFMKILFLVCNFILLTRVLHSSFIFLSNGEMSVIPCFAFLSSEGVPQFNAYGLVPLR